MVEDPLRFIGIELAQLELEGLLRVPPEARVDSPVSRSDLLILCSNDYLGYASEAWPVDSINKCPSGAGASRLVSGNYRAHEHAEQEIARWIGVESALLFSSGYAANIGSIGALAGEGDLIISDALNHASIIDGCRLSGARVAVVEHCSVAGVKAALEFGRDCKRRWVITESYFSMDGDIPDLAELRSLCDIYDAALIVDEAHALGVFGPKGTGLCAELGVRPDVYIGALGKAVGLHGAFVGGSTNLRTFLWNRARSFVFSTGISPLLANVIVDRVKRVSEDDHGRDRLVWCASALREGMFALRIPVSREKRGPVIPWVVGKASSAITLARQLREEGILVQAIRPPTVPSQTARLRVTANAGLNEADIEHALRAFVAVNR